MKKLLFTFILGLLFIPSASAATVAEIGCPQTGSGKLCEPGFYMGSTCVGFSAVETWYNTCQGQGKNLNCNSSSGACITTPQRCPSGQFGSPPNCVPCPSGQVEYPIGSGTCEIDRSLIYNDTAGAEGFLGRIDDAWKVISGFWKSDNGSDVYYDGGKVGIGTSSPTAILHVGGSQTVNPLLINSGGSNKVVFTPQGGFGLGDADPATFNTVFEIEKINGGIGNLAEIKNAGAGNTSLAFFRGSSASYAMGIDGADGDVFKINAGGGLTNSVDHFVINSSGNVGIGTTSPAGKLHVAGGRVEFTATTDASGIAGTGVLEIANALRLDGNEIITNMNTALYLQNDNNGDLRVDGSTLSVDASANRVGIGTTSPSNKLTVYGGYVGIDTPLNSGSSGIRILENNVQKWAFLYKGWEDDDLEIRDEGYGTVMTFKDQTGNIGIGTTSPGFKLEVAGRAKINSSDAGIWYEAGTNDWFIGRQDANNGSSLRWYNSGDKMVLTTGGNLQIDGDLTVSGGEIDIAWGPSYWTYVTGGSVGYVYTADTGIAFSNRYCFIRKSDQAFCEAYRSGTTWRLKQITPNGHPNGGCAIECLGIR